MVQKPFENIPQACSIGRHDECLATGCKWKIVLNEYCWDKRIKQRPLGEVTKVAEPVKPVIRYVPAEDTKPFYTRRTKSKNVGWPKPVANQPGIRELVYKRDGYRCLKCGTQEDLTLDEVVPRAKGGKRSVENCQTLCGPCNRKKGIDIIDYRTKEEPVKELDFTKIKTAAKDPWIQKIKITNEEKF